MKILSPYGISNIVLSVCLIAGFIGVFFFTVGKDIEQKIVSSQVKRLVDESFEDMKIAIPNDSLSHYVPLVEHIQQSVVTGMQAQDEQVAQHNDELKSKAFKVLGIIVASGITVVLLLWWKYRFDMKDLLWKNAVILCCVAVTEWFFLTYIAQSYRSADANTIKRRVIQKMQAFSQQ